MKIVNIDVQDTLELKDIYDTDTGTTRGINSKLKFPTGNVKTIILNFNFINPVASQEGLKLFATFKTNFLSDVMMAQLEAIEVDHVVYEYACYVPKEIMSKTGKVDIGVYGYIINEDGTLEKRLSLVPVSQDVIQGSYDENAIEGTVPTPSIFEIYFDEVQKASEKLNEKMMLYTKEEFTTTASQGVTTINLHIEDFSKMYQLLVYKNGLSMREDVEYTIDYDAKQIVLKNPIKSEYAEIHYIAFISSIVDVNDSENVDDE